MEKKFEEWESWEWTGWRGSGMGSVGFGFIEVLLWGEGNDWSINKESNYQVAPKIIYLIISRPYSKFFHNNPTIFIT